MAQIALDLWDEAVTVRQIVLLGHRARIRRNTLNGLRAAIRIWERPPLFRPTN